MTARTKRTIRLGVTGALGKMGSRVLALAAEDADFRVALALERADHPDLGKRIAGAEVVSSLDRIKDTDGVIEFTSPQATLDHLVIAIKYKKPMVIGTTGLTEEQKRVVARAAKKIPIVFSPNMSVGVNLLFDLVAQAARQLPSDYGVRMVEAHHVHKKDAPSGTAKFLAQVVRDSRGTGEIDIRSIREGEIIGDHEVVFESPWDSVRISHSAKTRDIFVLGALRAMKFVVLKRAGLYSMGDVIKGARGR